MTMRMRELVERLNRIKAAVKDGEATPEIAAACTAVTEQLRRTWSPEELKSSVAADAEVPTGIEEAMTTLFMLWMQHRGHG